MSRINNKTTGTEKFTTGCSHTGGTIALGASIYTLANSSLTLPANGVVQVAVGLGAIVFVTGSLVAGAYVGNKVGEIINEKVFEPIQRNRFSKNKAIS